MKRIIPVLIIALMILGCERNHKPVISDITCSPEIRNAGTVFTLKAFASDEDGDLLHYLWKADEGSFTTTTNTKEVKWKSPVTGAGKTYTLTVVVSDDENEVTRELQILLEEPELGNLQGHVYFTNFHIPISEVTVTAGNKTATTDQDGYFSILSIPAGEYTLTATKQDFGSFNSSIEIIPNAMITVTAEITSVNYTTKLSGIISDQNGQPLEYAQVVVLNPDGSESKLKSTASATGFYKLWYIPHGKRTLVVRRVSVDDFYFVELKEDIIFQEIETQLNLVLQKVSFNGEFTDLRDNHVYGFKTIGSSTWMTENLSYLPRVDPSANGSRTESFFYVYDYQGTNKTEAMATENYQEYGVLYNYTAAMEICPTGWRVPYRSEWNSLINQFGSLAGKKMKSKTGWSNHGNGDNTSGFSALPGGRVNDNGVFNAIGDWAYFWASTSYNSKIYVNALSYDYDGIFTFLISERDGCSVRCVRDK
ncbi:MAG: hypothetical protein D4R64_14040 [Porphyromonadaceae bacterium]|nr:MAG: hypothetical protein D4R64_14040 [Porphyromonadaceae bacterium]